MRGIAALMVLLYHAAELMQLPLPEQLLIIRTHFGLGVPLFFALSGFVLAYGYAGRLTSRYAIQDFYIRRFFRIAPLFYAMLLLWLLVSRFVFHQHFKGRDILLNLSFLFGLVPGKHESIVWAGWSIGVEMLFYMVFPLVAFLVRSRLSALIFLVLALLVSSVAELVFTNRALGSYAYMNLLRHAPYFAAGMLAHEAWRAWNFHRSRTAGAMLMGATIMATAGILWGGHDFLELLSSLGLSWLGLSIWAPVFCVLLVSLSVGSFRGLESGALRKLGQASFSLYLVHPLLMVGLIKAGFPAWVSSLSNSTALAFVVGAAATVGLVWAVSVLSFRFIEQPGLRLGRAVSRRWGQRPPARALRSTD